MSTELEKIIEAIRALPPIEQQRLREILDSESQINERINREETVRKVRGKYAGMLSSSEDFASRKSEEIELEDRFR